MNLALAHPLRRLLCLVTLSWMASSLSGCKPADPAQVSEPPAPKISGSQIVFPANAPQLSYLTSEPATETVTAAVGLYGRLAWDDDVTVRVFSPVSGRVQGIPVEVNQPVAVGDALALLDSPDFDQALADARTAVGNFAAADKAFSRAQMSRPPKPRSLPPAPNPTGRKPGWPIMAATSTPRIPCSPFARRSPAWSLRRTSPPARKSAPT
jgi:multidrug efflux pump subunit AcrA (membrane-fusion protein)